MPPYLPNLNYLRNDVKRLFGGLLIFCILLVAFWIPVQIPYVENSIGQVYPAREWKLLQSQAGRITSVIRDYRVGATSSIAAFQFENDISGVQFSIPPDRFVHRGDTVVRMYSIRQSEEIQEIEAQLALYKAQLRSDVTGSKESVVEGAENQLRFAEQDLIQKERTFKIKKPLWEQQLIAFTEYEEAEGAYKLAKIQVDIARQNLESVRTGLKAEGVSVTKAQLRGLRDRLEILRRKGLSYVICAPFDGWVVRTDMPAEEQYTLQEAGKYVVRIPIKIENLPYLNDQTVFYVTDMQTQRTFKAQLLHNGTKVEVLNQLQISNITALVETDSLDERLSTGISAFCQIDFGKIHQREYLRRILKFNW